MIGLMRVKNEQRFIERSVRSILPVCDEVLVMDDHSSDNTAEICAAIPGVRVFPSPFTGLNEQRDKNWLLDKARHASHVLMVDGDEVLTPESISVIKEVLKSENQCFRLKILFAWDREDQIRTDGVYGRFERASLFRPGNHVFESTAAGGNFHCGNAPAALQNGAVSIDASLLHFGYMHREDRLRKYEWYNKLDARNYAEDAYRHMVIGDVFPATAKFKWGGPLKLVPQQ